eukprot:3100405-Amphidinium_carterae.1
MTSGLHASTAHDKREHPWVSKMLHKHIPTVDLNRCLLFWKNFAYSCGGNDDNSNSKTVEIEL